jgi:hypothetical protein
LVRLRPAALRTDARRMMASPMTKAAMGVAMKGDYLMQHNALVPASSRVLPAELVALLNNAYFLHILATDPGQVLPPGKSLLSVMSRARTADDTPPTLQSKVEDLAHKAFWEEVRTSPLPSAGAESMQAVDTLSSPEPSAQLPRIKVLYGDLHDALSPLLPPSHPVLVTLSSPLSPTSSPLHSALVHLREVLASLRQRCAPVRDPDIAALHRPLDDPPTPVALATLVAETIRSILKLSEVMKDDLSQFVLGSMTEQQLTSVVAKQAKTSEREIVSDMWHRDGITQAWASWLQPHPSSSPEEPFLWIVRIVQALGSSLPVSCPFPSGTEIPPASNTAAPNANTLPPLFFFSTPTLLKIQNYLQALVIAASLRILTRLPSSSDTPDPDSFMSRVWTLLRAEIAGDPDASDTKLINLADEVVRARTQAYASTLSKDDDAALRAAVDRTLRYEDPVYKLLHRRLLTELSSVLVKRRQGGAARDAVAPATLRTGRDGERAGKRPRLVLDPDDMDDARTRSSPRIVTEVKGFEDPVLSRATVEVFEQVDSCLEWVERVWGDVVETGNVSSPRKSDK